MREIKFRAKAKSDGRFICGDLSYCFGEAYINSEMIYYDSISQFCGYDSEGNEIYEGDEVIAHDKIYTVELKPKYGLFNDLKFCVKK